MAKKTYIGIPVNGVGKSKRVPDIGYVGIGGKSKRLLKGYIGIAGKAKLFWEYLKSFIYNSGEWGNVPYGTGVVNTQNLTCVIDVGTDNTYTSNTSKEYYLSSKTLWTHEYNNNQWYVENDGSIANVINGADWRGYNELLIPIVRTYFEKIEQFNSMEVKIKVIVRGKTSVVQPVFAISFFRILSNGNIGTLGGYNFRAPNDNQYVEVEFTIHGYQVGDDNYIDYINISNDMNLSGNFEHYIKYIEISNGDICMYAGHDVDQYITGHVIQPVKYDNVPLMYMERKDNGVVFKYKVINNQGDVYRVALNDEILEKQRDIFIAEYISFVSNKPFDVYITDSRGYAPTTRAATQISYAGKTYYQYWLAVQTGTIGDVYVKSCNFNLSNYTLTTFNVYPVDYIPEICYIIFDGYNANYISRKASHVIDSKITYDISQPVPVMQPALFQFDGTNYFKEYVDGAGTVWLVIVSYEYQGTRYYFPFYVSGSSFYITNDYDSTITIATAVTYEGITYYICDSELHISKPIDHGSIVYEYEYISNPDWISQTRFKWEIAYIVINGIITTSKVRR